MIPFLLVKDCVLRSLTAGEGDMREVRLQNKENLLHGLSFFNVIASCGCFFFTLNHSPRKFAGAVENVISVNTSSPWFVSSGFPKCQ